MKHIVIISAIVAGLSLTGCATNRDAGAVTGAVAGGILGHSVGGVLATGVGAMAGAAIGSNVGASMDAQQSGGRTVVVREPALSHERVVIVSPVCNSYPTYREREACQRGARQRYLEEQRRREQEAYRQGIGR
jgi:hypothetical protein